MEEVRKEIANNIFQSFYGAYPFPKDWGRESKQCYEIADQILSIEVTEGVTILDLIKKGVK